LSATNLDDQLSRVNVYPGNDNFNQRRYLDGYLPDSTISTSSVSTMCVAKRHNDEAGADEEGEIPRRR
jgi:hypothetical protein